LLSSGSSTGNGRLCRSFCLDCEPDHISVVNADLFISYRTFPQSGRAPGKAVQRSYSARAALFFGSRPRAHVHPLSLVGSHWLKPGALRCAIGRDTRLSMISGQTLRVCPEGKPVPTIGSWPEGMLFRITSSADAFLDFDRGFPRRSWIHRSLARPLRKAQL